ncbi:sugar phosphate isomerase/epimerase [Corynebacterium glyciniphilum]|uniref:sugar phosphate isomerase/epimerase n=1 Tax=Corynebacterium glyciniphilum TaxID=1404244 RepID=UPI00235348FD
MNSQHRIELSLNQATTRPYTLQDTAECAAAAGIQHMGLWLEHVDATGINQARSILKDNGISPTSMCRVGFVAGLEGNELNEALDQTRRALDFCAELDVPYLTFIAGGFPTGDASMSAAEARVQDALFELVPHARATGVSLALEPIHPLFVTDRSIVTTIRQALRVVDPLPADQVGILVDSWAVFWDPDLRQSLADAGTAGRLSGYQVNDFVLPLPLPENMNGRVMPGDGAIDLATLTRDVLAAGYSAPVEVEVFNDNIWKQPLNQIVRSTVESFNRSIAAPLGQE